MGILTLVIAHSTQSEERIRTALALALDAARIVMSPPLASPAIDPPQASPLASASPQTDPPAGDAPVARAPAADDDEVGLIVLELPPERPDTQQLSALARSHPGTPIAAVGAWNDEGIVESCLRTGALSYLPAHYSSEQAALVLRLTVQGVGHRPNLVARATAAAPAPGEHARAEAAATQYRLTPRQVEVLAHAVEGLSNRQIAARLQVTEGVVRLHMSEIYRRLGVERRAEAIVKAMRIQEVIKSLVGHGENGKDILDWLLPHVTHRQLARGEVIFRKGEAGREMYYLQRGDVLLEEIDVQMRPGEMFGEIGVFAPDHSRTCTARCLTDVDLFCLDSEQVKRIYYLNPQFALHVVTLLARRLMADRDRAR